MSSADLEALRRTYQGLRVKHEQAEDKLADFRDKMKVLRQELNSKDRQLEVAKRMLQRVANDKTRAEAVSEQGKAEVRRLEARLTGDASADTQSKVFRLQAKLAEQSEETQQMEARMLLAEETNLQLGREVHVLKQALGMKQSSASGAMGSQAKLLHQLAAAQEESAALATQLAQGQRTMQDMRDELEASTLRVQQMQQAQAESMAQLTRTQQQVSGALESAASFRQEAELARSQLIRQQAATETESSARARAEQQAALHLGKVQQLSERLQSVERASRLSLEALRSEVTLAVERAESRAAEQRASATVKEANTANRCLQLQRALEAAEAQLQAEREQHAADGLHYKQQLEVLQDQVGQLKKVERSHILETGRLHGQLDTAAEVNSMLQARLESSEHSKTAVVELEQERRQALGLRSQIELLRSQMTSSVESHTAREHELESKVEMLEQELSVLSTAMSKLQAEALAACRQLSYNSAQTGQADQYVQELQQTVNALTASKSKLQSYMLDQLSLFKAKLQRAESDNQQLRAALATDRGLHFANGRGMGSSGPRHLQSSSTSMSAGIGEGQRARSKAHGRALSACQSSDDEDLST